jgi:hypothetical protein
MCALLVYQGVSMHKIETGTTRSLTDAHPGENPSLHLQAKSVSEAVEKLSYLRAQLRLFRRLY